MKRSISLLTAAVAVMLGAALVQASVSVGQSAPDFQVKDVSGKAQSLSAYKGWPGRRGARFVEVEVERPAVVVQQQAPCRYRVVLGERVVEVDQDFDDDVLRRLLRVVEGC